MNLTIKKKTINEILISTFVLVSVIFPGDIYNLKKILFFSICIINLRLIILSLINKENSILSLFGFVFPTILFLYSSIITGNIIVSFSRSFAAYMFLIIFVVKYYNLDFEKILINAIRIIMYATILLVTLDLIGLMSVNTGFFRNEIMYRYGIGLMGKSPMYPFYYKVFFRTSPLLVVLLFKRFNDSNYLTTFLTLFALVISGTRANALFPLFFLIYFYILYTGNKSKLIKYAFVFFAVIFTVIFSSTLLDVFNETFIVRGKVSDVVRAGHIEGIKELVRNDPWIIIRGSGMGSVFYSYGINDYTSSIEWSYIDLWRQMGFLFFFLFLMFIILPLFYNNKSGKYKRYAYLAYLCIAATNPLLFSSTSYLMFIYMYYDLVRVKQEQASEEDIK